MARTDFFTPALGLAALFAAIHALLPAAPVQGDVLGLVNGMRAMIASFALPALLVLCGIQAKASLGKPWLDYISETITPFAIALIAWALFVGFAGLPAGGAEGALANIHAHMKPVSILMAMPVFLILAKLLRGLRPVGLLFLAAFAEILHTNSGHFLIVDLLRGGVFFFGGVYFASYAQSYTRFAQERPGVSTAGLLIWLAFLAFVAFGHHHLAHG
ncbi:MAG: hypothetical protein FJX29_12245, partial [Alphaproteobacteria bacterium]|nr:hypothetical protein [Alphaproteobacteria bacterium]